LIFQNASEIELLPAFSYLRGKLPSMKKFTFILVASILISLSGCVQPKPQTQVVNLADATLYATLYQQQAAEYKALCFQAYNLASLRLNQSVNQKHSKPLAVVVDIDETVLDNSPYQAESILKNISYPAGWAEWMNMASAIAVPGAVEFLNEAAAKNVEVFYISNRKEEFKEVSLRNLKEKGFPYADSIHLMARTNSNDKEIRRQKVMEKFDIILLVGDNLGDFNSVFDETNPQTRNDQLLSNQKLFGDRWIILPNACYGTWVSSIPGYSNKINADSLMKVLKGNLKGF
jgi:5'-nucleotidase (lipoprotein e(P4) family)